MKGEMLKKRRQAELSVAEAGVTKKRKSFNEKINASFYKNVFDSNLFLNKKTLKLNHFFQDF